MNFKIVYIGMVCSMLATGLFGQDDKEQLMRKKEENMKKEAIQQAELKKSSRASSDEATKKSGLKKYQLSPDGKLMASLKSVDGRMNLVIRTIETNEDVILTRFQDEDIVEFAWGNNETLVYSTYNAGTSNAVLNAIGIDGSNQITLTPKSGVNARFVGRVEDDKESVVIETNERTGLEFDVYRVKLSDGSGKMILKNPGGLSNWVLNRSGDVVAARKREGEISTVVYRKNFNSSEWIVLEKTNYSENMKPLFVNEKGTLLYCLSNLGRERTAAVAYDLAIGQVAEVLFEHPQYNVEAILMPQGGFEPLGVSFISNKREYKYFNDSFAAAEVALRKKGDDLVITVVSASSDNTKLIIHANNGKDVGAYYLFSSYDSSLVEIIK